MIQSKTKKITLIAMMAALSYVVHLLGKFMLVGAIVLVPAAPFLQYDAKDIVIVIAAFLTGPLSGLIISLLVSLVEMITVSDTGYIGCIMNIISTCAFVCPAALVYKKNKTQKGAVLGLLLGVVMVTVAMVLWNYLITPLYMNTSREAVAGMLLPIFVPFNLLKASINMAITLILYKPIVRVLRRTGLVEPSEKKGTVGKKNVGLILGIVILVLCVACILLMKNAA